ncbi:MAG: DUF882 domain-containing protein [Aeromonas sp.]
MRYLCDAMTCLYAFFRRLALCAGLAYLCWAAPLSAQPGSNRELTIFNVNTNEWARIAYWRGGRYLPQGLQKLNHLFRDHRRDESMVIDKKLFDLLYLIQQRLGHQGEIQLISGYRSQLTNRQKHLASKGVAKRSFHMQGRAMDIRIPGIELSALRDVARQLNQGGVGYYPSPVDNFVHLDTGPVRQWSSDGAQY